MYRQFLNELSIVQYYIEKGQYQSFAKFYKEMNLLELQIDFSYRHYGLSFLEYNELMDKIRHCFFIFRLQPVY